MLGTLAHIAIDSRFGQSVRFGAAMERRIDAGRGPETGNGRRPPYIVILKNQLTGSDASDGQAAVAGELNQVRAARIKQFRTVNSLAATVTDVEMQHLKTNTGAAPEAFFVDARIAAICGRRPWISRR